jgi:hypothetical protein
MAESHCFCQTVAYMSVYLRPEIYHSLLTTTFHPSSYLDWAVLLSTTTHIPLLDNAQMRAVPLSSPSIQHVVCEAWTWPLVRTNSFWVETHSHPVTDLPSELHKDRLRHGA